MYVQINEKLIVVFSLWFDNQSNRHLRAVLLATIAIRGTRGGRRDWLICWTLKKFWPQGSGYIIVSVVKYWPADRAFFTSILDSPPSQTLPLQKNFMVFAV